MREIVAVQVGGFANFIGSHFWNFQDEMLGLAADPYGDPLFKTKSLNMDILYRTGSLGSVSSKGTLYNEDSSAPSEVVTWAGNVSSHASEPRKKNLFLQSFYQEEQGAPLLNGINGGAKDSQNEIQDTNMVSTSFGVLLPGLSQDQQPANESSCQAPLVPRGSMARRGSSIPTGSTEVTPTPQECQAAVDELGTSHTVPGEESTTVDAFEASTFVNILVGETSHVIPDHENESVAIPMDASEETCGREVASGMSVREDIHVDPDLVNDMQEHPLEVATTSRVQHASTNVHPMVTRRKNGIVKPRVFQVHHHRTPSDVHKALADPKWKDAVMAEYEALVNNGTWDIVELPVGRKAVGCKWLFKVKLRADGIVDRYKARLVAKGYA
ncbi:hypothetical protein V6N11_021856 [Hibiscus sabdariffa]|uniref:Uncharacterized protein n=1 Tax=Hibiscus sabdariffa TaxID=183260 RepID=A0ABR2THI4_9ROSI